MTGTTAHPLVASGVVYTPPVATGRLLAGLDLRVEPGEIVGLTGPSGSGKTTIVRLLSGLIAPDAGSVRLGDAPVGEIRAASGRAVRGRIGVTFQSPRAAMDPRMRLDRAIELSAREAARRGPAGARPVPLDGLAETLGLTSGLLHRRPHEVSDGQLQRAALLRTLAHQPEIVLCDEITAALDRISAAVAMRLLDEIAHRHGRGVLVVSHDHPLVVAVADRVLMVGNGRTVQRPSAPTTLSDPHSGIDSTLGRS